MMKSAWKNRGGAYWLSVLLSGVVGLSCKDNRTRIDTTSNENSAVVRIDEPLPTLATGLTIRLTPKPEQPELLVELHVVGPLAASVKELSIAKQWAGIEGFASIHSLRVRDATGEIAARPGPDAGPDRTLVLDRPAQGEHLEVRYGVLSAPAKAPRFALHVDHERFSGVGHTFLLLPRFEQPIPMHLQIRPNALAPGATGASSFGNGDDIETSKLPRDIAHAVYAAGRLRAMERPGAGRLLLLGRPSFDAESAHSTISRAHQAVDRTFLGPQTPTKPRDFVYVVMSEPGFRGHDGTLLNQSFGLWMSTDAPFDSEMTIAAAHELAHSWLGGALRLVNESGEEQAWFSEGFAVHYARKVALAEKLISPEEFAADLERTIGAFASDLGSHTIPRSREAYQRGALYAASLDVAIKKASKGKRSLDDLMRTLSGIAAAKKTNTLPIVTFRDVLVEELGASFGEELSWVMVQGHGEIRVDDDAFGNCFYRSKTKKKTPQVGFDEVATMRPPQMIRGLVKGSAAARAGLVEGAIVLSSKLHPEFSSDWDKPVEVVIATPRGSKTVRYAPVSEYDEVHWAAKKGCVD